MTELAQRTESTKSQIFRLLYTLEQRGFVRKDADSRSYALGYRTLYVSDKTKATKPSSIEYRGACFAP